MDLDSAQKETRNASSELFRVKSAYEEAVLQLDEVRRENKNLSNEYVTMLCLHPITCFPPGSRTSWTRSARVDAPSMRLTKSVSVLKLKSLSFKLL